MRIWGRNYAPDGSYTWVKVEPDANGNTDYLYVTQLIQVLKLNLNESPFYADFGIPAQQSVVTQIFPDFYVNQTQTQFSARFASLTVSKVANPEPTYNVNITTHQGTKFQAVIPV
jgi:hypothetical protein